MTINDDTLDVDVWNEMRTCIVAAAPFITNSTTASTTAASVKAMYNDESASKPLIVVNDPITDETMNKFGGSTGSQFISVPVDCYYKNTLGAAQLLDQVRKSVKAYDWGSLELSAILTDVAFNLSNGSKVHQRNITFTFIRE